MARKKLAKIVGANIRRAREAAGLKQAELARRLKRGRSNVHRWENGGGGPPLETLDEIARVLNCEPATLLGNEAA